LVAAAVVAVAAAQREMVFQLAASTQQRTTIMAEEAVAEEAVDSVVAAAAATQLAVLALQAVLAVAMRAGTTLAAVEVAELSVGLLPVVMAGPAATKVTGVLVAVDLTVVA
jgi:hypothetical protein